MKKLALAVIGLSLSAACTDEPDNPISVNPEGTQVWVLNEGGFQAGNASLGIYNTDEKEYSAKVFESTNSRALGDVLNSALEIDGKIYLVVNNSGKIEIVNKDNYESTGTISGLSSPRSILPISANEAVVSDVYSDSLAVVNLTSNEIDRYINISSPSEEMVLAEGKLFVTGYKGFVSVVDLSTDSVTNIATTFNPVAIDIDKNGKVWVFCGGDSFNSIYGALEVIDPVTEIVEKTLALPSAAYPARMTFNGSHDSVYFMISDVFKMSVEANTVPSQPFIKTDNFTYPFALDYDTASNEIFVTDAIDFNQSTKVFIYDRSGNQKESFNAGIGANGFLFID